MYLSQIVKCISCYWQNILVWNCIRDLSQIENLFGSNCKIAYLSNFKTFFSSSFFKLQMYLSQFSKYISLKLENVFVSNCKIYLSQIAKCFFSNYKIYFFHIAKYICPKLQNIYVSNCKMYLY